MTIAGGISHTINVDQGFRVTEIAGFSQREYEGAVSILGPISRDRETRAQDEIRRRPSPMSQWLDYLPTAVIDSLSNREMLHVIREHAVTKRRDECAATIDEMIDYF
jgi:hypothetical protein